MNVKLGCDFQKEEMIVKVIDSGIGMTQEQIGKLFRPFSQADASTTRRYGGTGLGLHLSKQLVEKLGGALTVHSTPEVGSRFILTIRTGSLAGIAALTNSPDFENLETSLAGRERQIHLKGRVLLVEDNEDNQRLVSILLKRMGVTFEIANNGKEAIAIASEHHFDAVLMDMQMPVMNGLTATRLLREQGYNRPVIALTANAMQQEKQECIEAGCNDVCTKPIDHDSFGKVLSRYLDRAQAPDNTSGPPIVSSLLAEEPELVDLIREFVNRLPAMIRNIAERYAENDIHALRHEVHTLKGTGGNFGYPDLFELTKRIEFEIVAGNMQSVGELISALAIIAGRIEQGMGSIQGKGRVHSFPGKS